MDASEFIQDSNLEYSYFGKDGNTTKQRRLSLAYYIEEDGTAGQRFVKFYRGSIFDPYGMDANRANSNSSNESSFMGEFRKVNEKTFKFYIDYLKTRQRNKLVWAEREYINV